MDKKVAIITQFSYKWNFDYKSGLYGGYEQISKSVLSYCKRTKPFNEKEINADYYIIFYSYFDCKFCDLIIEIVKRIKENNKKIIGIFSSPFKWEGTNRNIFAKIKMEEVISIIDKSYMEELWD